MKKPFPSALSQTLPVPKQSKNTHQSKINERYIYNSDFNILNYYMETINISVWHGP